ncbi:MAG: phosphoenolpyruvate--protein phosphotransferase [Acetobacteraceae bacterium]|nr:phosphoenolpyruvate--protein phosphotransferase [Acetobacteraceae bacterium]
MAERRFVGRGAAPGLAEGPLFRLRPAGIERVARGDASAEAALLRAALATARDQLAELAAAGSDEAAGILSFQVALLEDPVLAEPALAAIATGEAADLAWKAAMAAEIAGYKAAEDEYFRARAADLADLCERVLGLLAGAGAGAGAAAPPPPGAILLAEDLPPSRFLAIDWSAGGGVALAAGSPSSHVAMLARARGVPMAVGFGTVPDEIAEAVPAMLDGGAGVLVIAARAATAEALRRAAGRRDARRAQAGRFLRLPAATADGVAVRVMVNVADPAELETLDVAMCDGIGLTRTEFLFHGSGGPPGEEAQYAAYARILAWASGRPVVLRTLDAGGDKPVPGLTAEGESNPFLGVRGIRLSLARPELFRVQLRAMARAAALGTVRVMLPMVSVPGELAAARAMLEHEIADLRRAGIACARPSLGIMVEVPAAALCAERFDADFYSIGSNDLTQYTMAAARDIAAVAALNDAANPAVLALVARTLEAGQARGVEVSLCGDAAGDPGLSGMLLRAGLRTLSMAPAAVAEVKQAIAAITLGAGARNAPPPPAAHPGAEPNRGGPP